VKVLGISAAYSLFGAFSALSGNLFGRLLQSNWAYLLVGVICLFLGLSLFGLFNPNLSSITLPFKKMKSKGLWDAFFIGFISAFIISPCTTPVLGTILIFVAMRKNVFFGTTLLFTFALGMGFLLVIIGTFSGIFSSMPKSGKWMARIKKGFALFLLGVSVFYFLKAGGLL
ncbi:MAG: sulfite exporter TauE/SafE family protein, partial [Candidatus Omnitrophica bacterium]|nr:sulfite exporter TauE/SafE family protein [Candidatus Omnitrophota bacterium]